jgi:hypothetical protein
MKLFGKELFNKKSEPQELYDFAQHGLIRAVSHIGIQDINLSAISGDDEIAANYLNEVDKNNRKAAEQKKKEQGSLTPKAVYELGTLTDKNYILNTDEKYIRKNVLSLEKKMKLLPDYEKHGSKVFVESYGASKNGRLEMQSMIDRLSCRLKYAANQDFFEQYPYTRSDLINNILAEHTNLRSKRVEEFIPDMPDEAVEHMNAYNNKVLELTSKKAVFYIIADKKDFGEIDKKRDPILLAQSPFALAWQVLGAWDEEMIYLGDL